MDGELIRQHASSSGGAPQVRKLGRRTMGLAIGPRSEIDTVFVADSNHFQRESPIAVTVGAPYLGELSQEAEFWPARRIDGAYMELVTFDHQAAALGYAGTKRMRYSRRLTHAEILAAGGILPFYVCGRRRIVVAVSANQARDINWQLVFTANNDVGSGTLPYNLTPTVDTSDGWVETVSGVAVGGVQAYEFPLKAGGPSGLIDQILFSVLPVPTYVDGTAFDSVKYYCHADD